MTRPVRINAHDSGTDAWRMTWAAPAAPLSPYLSGYSAYHERTGSFSTRRELPSLDPVLIVNTGPEVRITGGDGAVIRLGPGEGFVAGIHERHALSWSSGEQSGIHLHLTMRGLLRLLGHGAGAIADQVVPVGELLGRNATELGQQLRDTPDPQDQFDLLDHLLAPQLAAGHAPRRELAWAFHRIRQAPDQPIAALAAEIGWSRKTLAALFRASYGVTPKTAARLARFERAIAACNRAKAPDWADVAQGCGYYDQSHLIRDFAGFTGLTPTAYRRQLLPDGGGLLEA